MELKTDYGRTSYVIETETRWHDFRFKEVWQYRDLIVLLVRRNFVGQYKQTVLGPAWAVIQPLLTTVVFTVIFGNLAALPTDDMPPFLFYMSANVAWGFFSSCLTMVSSTFLGNAGILGKVYFPRLVMPISMVIERMITFFIQFVLFLIILLAFLINPSYGIAPNIFMLLTPLLILQMSALAIGCGIIISSLTVKYRDLGMLVGFGMQLWMYLTPIAYASSTFPERFRVLFFLNPMTPVIEAFRYAFLGSGTLPITYLIISAGTASIILFFGLIIFNRAEKTFLDTI